MQPPGLRTAKTAAPRGSTTTAATCVTRERRKQAGLSASWMPPARGTPRSAPPPPPPDAPPSAAPARKTRRPKAASEPASPPAADVDPRDEREDNRPAQVQA